MTAPDDPFITYQMADGSHIDEYTFVTELDWFDDRDREVRLIKRNYTLVSEEEIVLPDPYPSEDDEDDEDERNVDVGQHLAGHGHDRRRWPTRPGGATASHAGGQATASCAVCPCRARSTSGKRT